MKAAAGIAAGMSVGGNAVVRPMARPMSKAGAAEWIAGAPIRIGDFVCAGADGRLYAATAESMGSAVGYCIEVDDVQILTGRKVRDSDIKMDFVSWSVPKQEG